MLMSENTNRKLIPTLISLARVIRSTHRPNQRFVVVIVCIFVVVGIHLRKMIVTCEQFIWCIGLSV